MRFKTPNEYTEKFWETVLGHLEFKKMNQAEVSCILNRDPNWFNVLFHWGRPMNPRNINMLSNALELDKEARSQLHKLAALGIGYEI
jgi:hypothetical protein